MQHDPSSHRVPDRAVLDESVGRNLAHHVEVHRVVADLSTLPHLIELDSLDLYFLEPLADYHVAAEVVAHRVLGDRWDRRERKVAKHRVSPRYDTDAAGQETYCGTRVDRGPS